MTYAIPLGFNNISHNHLSHEQWAQETSAKTREGEDGNQLGLDITEEDAKDISAGEDQQIKEMRLRLHMAARLQADKYNLQFLNRIDDNWW